MDFIDKVKLFQGLDDLKQEIMLDKNTNQILSRRFPVRLIFLKRFQTFRQLIIELSKLNILVYHLENELPHEDGWITKDVLINKIKEISHDSVVVPFSELIRFYSEQEFVNFFHNLLLYENSADSSGRRIYLPLIGIEQRFDKEFFQNFNRSDESAPIWGILNEQPDNAKVYIVKKLDSMILPDSKIIKCSKDWLRFWKSEEANSVIISSSKPLNLYYNNTLPDSIFTIDYLKNVKELIETVFKKSIPISYDDLESEFWNLLLAELAGKQEDYLHFVKERLKTPVLNTSNVLFVWLRLEDNYLKWLLKHYIISQNCLLDKYIYHVFVGLEDFTDHSLLRSLFLTIFNLPMSNGLLMERIDLIHQFYKEKPITLCPEVIDEIKSKVESLEDLPLKIGLLTGKLDFEKFLALNLFNEDKDIDPSIFDRILPELTYYISNSSYSNLAQEHSWIIEYLEHYKYSKLSNQLNSSLLSIINRINKDQETFYTWYHSLKQTKSVIHSIDVDKIIWIDALGMEWSSFIERYIYSKKTDYQVVDILLATCELPSSTDQNKFANIKHVLDYDNFIHQKNYNYPESIFAEFEIIKSIIDREVALNSNQSIALISDHGLTALSRLANSKKYNKNDSHEGRYILVEDAFHSEDPDYIVHHSDLDGKNYLVALKHNSLGYKPVRQTHGGCTPEEVLVPVIIISNKKKATTSEHLIAIQNTELSRLNNIVSFSISPEPVIAFIQIKNRKIKLSYNPENEFWETEIEKTLTGKITVTVIVENTTKQFTVNILTGLNEEELF